MWCRAEDDRDDVVTWSVGGSGKEGTEKENLKEKQRNFPVRTEYGT